MILLNQESVTQGRGAQPPPGSSQAQPSAAAGGGRRLLLPWPRSLHLSWSQPPDTQQPRDGGPGVRGSEGPPCPVLGLCPVGRGWGRDRGDWGDARLRAGLKAALVSLSVSACMCVCVCVALCACTRVRGEEEGWAKKGGGGSQGGKKKREREKRGKRQNLVTSPLICIGAGIKPPRQRAPFILACGAAAAASGGTEHHRAATPVGPAAPPATPPGPSAQAA